MTDSSSFSSLFALVESHLSKCNLNDSPSEDGRIGSFPIPSLDSIQKGLSDTHIQAPTERLPIPSFSLSESPIANVLSNQLSNMLKAKELKKQQEIEQEKINQEMQRLKLEEKNCVIDLMKAVQRPGQAESRRQEVLSSSSSCESLVLDYKDFTSPQNPTNNESKAAVPSPEPIEILPINQDMSYILTQDIKMAKCSAFGKVLTSRIRPVAAPYLREKIKSNIVRFDFKTKSPCDLIKEKLQKKPVHCASNTYHDFF